MLDYLGKTEIPVTIVTVGHIRTLRGRQPGDEGNKDVFLTWLFFRKTQENHISVTLELAFHSDFFFALYKDNVLEWSSMAMYTFELDADIACYLTTHCGSLVDNPDVGVDYRTLPDEDEPAIPSVATPGDLAGRFANGVFESVWSSCFPAFGGRPDPIESSLRATQAILNMLSGGQEDFPRMDLVVSQNVAECEYRRLRDGEQFTDGTRVTLDATRVMDVPKQHEIVKAWLKFKE